MRDGHKERLVLDTVIKRAGCVAGRAATCWKAHCAGKESKAPLVIKSHGRIRVGRKKRLLKSGVTNSLNS